MSSSLQEARSITVEEHDGKKIITSTVVEKNSPMSARSNASDTIQIFESTTGPSAKQQQHSTQQTDAQSTQAQEQQTHQQTTQQFQQTHQQQHTDAQTHQEDFTDILVHDVGQIANAGLLLTGDIVQGVQTFNQKLISMGQAYSDTLKPAELHPEVEVQRKLRAQNAKGLWANLREAWTEFIEGATEMRDYLAEQIEWQEQKSFVEKPTAAGLQRELIATFRGKKHEEQETLETH